jgi:hypothetical protein
MRAARKDPKRLLERDLVLAAVGLFFVILGSVITAGGVEGRGPYSSAAEPGIGNVVVWIGLAIVATGLILAVGNVLMYSSARRRARRRMP